MSDAKRIFSALLVALLLGIVQHSVVSGTTIQKRHSSSGGQRALKCDPKVIGGLGSSVFHVSGKHHTPVISRNFTVAMLAGGKGADCVQEGCPTGDACEPVTSVCQIDCGYYPHEIFCDCFYQCDGCDRPVINPCPDGTMYDVEARCCATASIVACDGRVPYGDYVWPTTESGAGTTLGEAMTTDGDSGLTTAKITTAPPAETTAPPPDTTTTAKVDTTTTEKLTTTAERDTTTTERLTTTTERKTTTAEKETTTAEHQTTTTTEKQTTTSDRVTTTEKPPTTTSEPQETTTKHSGGVTTAKPIDFTCPHDGYFPYPTSCHCFVECVSGIPITVTCPSNMEYDPTAQKCRAPWGCVPQIGNYMGTFMSLEACPA